MPAAPVVQGPPKQEEGSPRALMEHGTVLIVDDDPVLSQMARRMLQDRLSHVNVMLAPDATMALRLLETERIDAVVADFRMPGMDGMALLEAVRDRWPQCGRLLLTASDDVHLAVRAVNEQLLDYYLMKPVRAPALAQAVADALVMSLKRRLEADIRKAEGAVVAEAMALARSLRVPRSTSAAS